MKYNGIRNVFVRDLLLHHVYLCNRFFLSFFKIVVITPTRDLERCVVRTTRKVPGSRSAYTVNTTGLPYGMLSFLQVYIPFLYKSDVTGKPLRTGTMQLKNPGVVQMHHSYYVTLRSMM